MPRRVALPVFLFIAALAIWALWGRHEPSEPTSSTASADPTSGLTPLELGRPRSSQGLELARISGKIVDTEGHAIAGASACARYRHESRKVRIGPDPVCVEADADGHYEIEGLMARPLTVSAQASGHAAAYHRAKGESRSGGTIIEPRAGESTNDVDIQLQGGAVEVFGVVEDMSGGPVEGARVDLWSSGRGLTLTAPALARSDEAGKFSGWMLPGNATARAIAEGYSPGTESGRAPGSTLRVRLTPESVIEGRVVDATTSKPVADIEVMAHARGPSQVDPVQSGADGSFRLTGLGPGEYTLAAKGPRHFGSEPGVVVMFASTTEVELRLHPAATLEAQVLAPDGEPCPNPHVSLQRTQGSHFPSGRGGEEGIARVEGLYGGSYTPKILCDGHLPPEQPEAIEVDPSAGVITRVYKMREAQVLRGRVVDEAGQPVSGVKVWAKVAGVSFGQRPITAEVREADGRFTLKGLRPGAYELTLGTGWSHTGEGKTEVTVPEKGDAEEVELVAATKGRVFGVVRDEDGKPLAGVSVRATHGRVRDPQGFTNDLGEYELVGVPTGTIRISVHKGLETQRAPGTTDDDVPGELVEVEPGGSHELDLVVARASGVITGRVLGPDGAPVGEAFVMATRMDETKTGRNRAKFLARSGWGSWVGEPVLTDAEGRFRLEGLSDGRYYVRAYLGQGDAVVEDVELGSDIEVKIEASAAIRGQVTAVGALPFALQCSLVGADNGISRSHAVFGSDGRFAFEGLPAGVYRINVSSDAGDGKSESIEVEAGAVVDDVKIVLGSKVRLTGRLVDLETREPVAGMRVFAGRPQLGEGKTQGPDVTGADGRFVLDDASAETPMLSAMPLDPDGGWTWTTVKIDIPEGATEHDLGDLEVIRSRLGDAEGAGDLGLRVGKAVDDKLPIAVVVPGGPAAKAGVVEGDILLAVDGIDVTGDHTRRFTTLTRIPEGESVELEFEGGKTAKVVAGPPEAR